MIEKIKIIDAIKIASLVTTTIEIIPAEKSTAIFLLSSEYYTRIYLN